MPDFASTSGANVPVWTDTAAVPDFPQLAGDLTVDVAVVGGGIAGVSTAHRLQQEGLKVALLEDGRIGGGETGRTTAHLATGLDDRYAELERLHGGEGARLAAESHAAAIDWIERMVDEEGIDCGFERLDGYLFAPPGDSGEILEMELRAAHRAGLTGTELLERAPVNGFFDTGRCLRFPRQGQFHPVKYLSALARRVESRGGIVRCGTHVTAVHGGHNTYVTTATGHTVRCGAVVVATNVPVIDRVVMQTKLEPYRSYVVALQVPRGSVAAALYWDTLDPYHYVRIGGRSLTGDRDLVIIGGEDHKTGQAEDFEERFRRLEEWGRERFPMADAVEYHWSGQVIEPVDSLAYIGRNPLDRENVFVVTGDSGNGMTHGVIAGLLLTDLITERSNRWERLYDPARVSLRSTGEFACHNLNVLRHYGDWLTGGDYGKEDDIPAGKGGVVVHGLERVAAYREPSGRLHRLSAVCPHLGCVVTWNNAERTWDCPCHGSRYSPTGTVINGPSNEDLKPL